MNEESKKDIKVKFYIGCKVISLMKIMTLIREEAPANFVPAAAVIRKGRALSRMIGRKGFVGGICCYMLNFKLIFKSAYNTLLLEYRRG